MVATVSVLEMNGDKISRSLNYIPTGKGYYNIVVKDMKMIRCKTAEETLSEVKKLSETGVEHIYVKVPAALTGVSLDNLRIA